MLPLANPLPLRGATLGRKPRQLRGANEYIIEKVDIEDVYAIDSINYR